MALSNWDTLAISETGESINGKITSACGVTVEFYKNWLYVQDPKGWHGDGAFSEPVVMEIRSGSLEYHDVRIEAARGPQNGCYAIVKTGKQVMAGCGVSGYMYPPAPCGHDANQLGSMSTSAPDDCSCGNEEFHYHSYCIQCDDIIPEAEWAGVSPECVDFLRKLLTEEIPSWLDTPEEREADVHFRMAAALDKATRFNQGDAYFNAAGVSDIAPTIPGEAQEPVISKFIKGD
jgi:hypothetical protein